MQGVLLTLSLQGPVSPAACPQSKSRTHTILELSALETSQEFEACKALTTLVCAIYFWNYTMERDFIFRFQDDEATAIFSRALMIFPAPNRPYL